MSASGDACPRRLSYVTGPEDEGRTVERILRSRLHLTATMVRRAKFRENGIMLDGQRVHSNVRVHAGQNVSVLIGDPEGAVENSLVVPAGNVTDRLRIVFEDRDLVVCDKPAGLPVHPGPGHFDDTLGNLLMAHYLDEGEVSGLHPVQRLDRETSGLLVVAKSAFVQNRLQRAMHTGDFTRRYLALCEGTPETPAGTVDAPIGLAEDGRHREVRVDGKPAQTRYRVVRGDLRLSGHEEEPFSLLMLELVTGRTHQVRVHMAHIGHPLLGDGMYGHAGDLMGRTALHSSALEMRHPVTGEQMRFASPLPKDMRGLLDDAL